MLMERYYDLFLLKSVDGFKLVSISVNIELYMQRSTLCSVILENTRGVIHLMIPNIS